MGKLSTCGYFAVAVQRTDELARLSCAGELDLGSAAVLAEAVAGVEADWSGPTLMDLADVSFLDCSGLAVLLGAFNRALRDDRKLVIVNPRPSVRRIFVLTGCAHLLSDPGGQGGATGSPAPGAVST